MVFPIHPLSVLGLDVCYFNENSLNCTSGLVLLCFFTSSNKNLSLYLILPPFRHLREIFDFSRLVSLFSHSAKSVFRQQLLSKAIQNERSQYKKNETRNRNGINP